ncbi:MAG: hypothetical protein E3K36_10930 [Candidatus Brocadia sp.]|nr:hypothetical protein [Candidatus Brocadia sp.]
MTYCAGWKYRGSVFLIADTAITKPDKPSLDYSSFGQLHSDTKDGYVQESLLKLVPISEGTAIGFAGNVAVASEIIGLLKDNVAYAESARELTRFADGMGPFDPKRGVALLIASSTPDGKSELIKWDTAKGLDKSDADYYEIGSLTSYHAALTPSVLKVLASGSLAVDRVLAIIAAIVQSYGVHDDLIQMNVGGLIFGLSTAQGKVSWQEDTNYLLYGPNISSVSYISAISRENAVIVNSSLTNDTRVFSHSVSVDQSTLLSQDWRSKVREQLDSDSFRYWVFFSLQGKVITIVIRHNLETQSKYVRLSHLGEGKFDLAISPELQAILCQPLEEKNDGSIPFRLNVRND